MRADARHNHDRLLEVAADAFARDGVGTSLKGIAREAGVGIGTLYRRFPTREALVDAVYHDQVERLCAAADDLVRARTPALALRAWMESFIDFMATKNGMGDVLKALLTSEVDRLRTRERLRSAIATLLDAGITAGEVRTGTDPGDVLMALGGITLIAGEESARDLASRLITLTLGGICAQPADPAATAFRFRR